MRRRVLLVSMPGLVQKATESMLAACPEVDLIATAPGALSATHIVSTAHPDLLLIDATLADEEVEALLGWVRDNYPGVECAAMTVTSRQSELVLQWGAHVAIHRGGLSRGLNELLNCSAAATARAADQTRGS